MRARSAFVSDQHEQIPMPMPISPESVGMLCCWPGHAAKPRFEEGHKLLAGNCIRPTPNRQGGKLDVPKMPTAAFSWWRATSFSGWAGLGCSTTWQLPSLEDGTNLGRH